MAYDVLKRIRDPFFTMKRESGGTGLGLAISDRIVAEHGGNMDFVSTVGHGTTVRASFPVKTRVTEKRGV
jgi:signal transduction histidine kinase